ncbi:unnamed protein product, partial [Sphenostylis stenocarpa]
RRVNYDRAAITEFLGDSLPLEEGQQCDYTRLWLSQETVGARWRAIHERRVANLLYIPNRSFQLGVVGTPRRIRRTDMMTLAQVWMTFLLFNIVPFGHVSDLNMPRCNLLYCLIREDITVDVASIISEEIHRFVNYEINKNNQKHKGALGFPALITTLCQAQGVEVELTLKI